MKTILKNGKIYDCFPKFIRDSLLGKGDTMPRTVLGTRRSRLPARHLDSRKPLS
ncbi:MAG: hypothetical protein IJR77_03815 [Bacteroidales bacterium]|nr:hypothetical protein [Bacteroidales bacterium]